MLEVIWRSLLTQEVLGRRYPSHLGELLQVIIILKLHLLASVLLLILREVGHGEVLLGATRANLQVDVFI